jgi:hypothetical protein
MEAQNNILMKSLQELLTCLDANSKEIINETFEKIADELINNYHIQKGKEEYYFMHIEFYFCNKNHLDIITYPRKLDAGKWFFHQSGVDLTLKSSYEGQEKAINTSSDFFFGGILIRDIVKRSNLEKKFGGPYKCEWELFDFLDAFSPTSQVPYLDKNKQSLGININDFKIKREFSYDEQKIKNKYNELFNYYSPKIDLEEETFKAYLGNINYGYKVKRDIIISKLKDYDYR